MKTAILSVRAPSLDSITNPRCENKGARTLRQGIAKTFLWISLLADLIAAQADNCRRISFGPYRKGSLPSPENPQFEQQPTLTTEPQFPPPTYDPLAAGLLPPSAPFLTPTPPSPRDPVWSGWD